MPPVDPVIPEIAIHFFVLAAGFYTLYRGWRLVKYPDRATLRFTAHVAIALCFLFGGLDAAQQLRAELTTPARMRRSGIYALLGGTMLSLGGALQVLAWLLRSVGG
ncbi:MAG TPA: hypothetical protein VLC95_19935 [Anaerolineae bacterium]|nr:hypothetical protein [Anaerolineae bacterium]